MRPVRSTRRAAQRPRVPTCGPGSGASPCRAFCRHAPVTIWVANCTFLARSCVASAPVRASKPSSPIDHAGEQMTRSPTPDTRRLAAWVAGFKSMKVRLRRTHFSVRQHGAVSAWSPRLRLAVTHPDPGPAPVDTHGSAGHGLSEMSPPGGAARARCGASRGGLISLPHGRDDRARSGRPARSVSAGLSMRCPRREAPHEPGTTVPAGGVISSGRRPAVHRVPWPGSEMTPPRGACGRRMRDSGGGGISALELALPLPHLTHLARRKHVLPLPPGAAGPPCPDGHAETPERSSGLDAVPRLAVRR